jgi:hypothetical protein
MSSPQTIPFEWELYFDTEDQFIDSGVGRKSLPFFDRTLSRKSTARKYLVVPTDDDRNTTVLVIGDDFQGIREIVVDLSDYWNSDDGVDYIDVSRPEFRVPDDPHRSPIVPYEPNNRIKGLTPKQYERLMESQVQYEIGMRQSREEMMRSRAAWERGQGRRATFEGVSLILGTGVNLVHVVFMGLANLAIATGHTVSGLFNLVGHLINGIVQLVVGLGHVFGGIFAVVPNILNVLFHIVTFFVGLPVNIVMQLLQLNHAKNQQRRINRGLRDVANINMGNNPLTSFLSFVVVIFLILVAFG